jgi:hypothetical protein
MKPRGRHATTARFSVSITEMQIDRAAISFICLLLCLSSCGFYPPRPRNVSASAVWADHTFIDCSVDKASRAYRCTVYKDDTGDILADGSFAVNNALATVDPSELHYAAYKNGTIYLADAQLLVLVSPSKRDPQIRLILDTLKNLATHGIGQAIDCGQAPDNGKVSALSNCVLSAFADRKAFHVRYDRPSFGSVRWHALAGDTNGNVFEVDYDSMGWSKHNLPDDIQLLDDGHIVVMPCPKPVVLAKANNGILSCVTLPRHPSSLK